MPQHARPEESSQPPRPAPTGIFQVVHLDAMEHAWAVAPGIVVHGYGYNAQVPGPTVEATVGDTLLVRFTNSLTEPTSICWHLPGFSAATACMDPAAAPVQPGGTVEYPLQLIDAGTYWYHSRLDDSPQTDRGLYRAPLRPRPVRPPRRRPPSRPLPRTQTGTDFCGLLTRVPAQTSHEDAPAARHAGS